MAEILLKVGTVGPEPLYQDGDVIFSANQRWIRCAHASAICKPRNAGFTSSGHRPPGVSEQFLLLTSQYKAERINRTTIRRTNLFTLEVDEVSDVPNAKGAYMDVPLYLQRRLAHENHHIFGTPGREVFYGGHTDASNAKLDLVWNAIETMTPLREVDHFFLPWPEPDRTLSLPISIDDCSDQEREDLMDNKYETIEGEKILKYKRKCNIDYAGIGLRRSVAAIRNRGVSADARATHPLDNPNIKRRASIVRIKV